MFVKFICCDVFTRIACDLVSKSPHIIDLEFVPMLSHVEPDKLRDIIREKLEKAVNESGRKYEAIMLGFGLCGNAITGLSCSIPMVIPRAHDCCTVFMGSKENFIAAFGDVLSARWCSTGYFERTMTEESGYPLMDQQASYKTSAEYMKYLEDNDEETADYLWETMHPKIETDECVYIKIDGFEYSDSLVQFKSMIEKENKQLRIVDGNVSLLKALIDGTWDDNKFQVVPPGKKVVGVYDMEYVIKAED